MQLHRPSVPAAVPMLQGCLGCRRQAPWWLEKARLLPHVMLFAHAPKSLRSHLMPLAAGMVAAGLQLRCPVRAMVVLELEGVLTSMYLRLGG
jgi:hypothetical protein